MSSAAQKKLKQSSKITNAPSYPLLIQEKTSRLLLYWALRGGKVMNPGDIYEIPMESLRESLNCRDDGELKKTLQSLVEYKINWEAFCKRQVDLPYLWGYSSLLADCVITKTHTIKYSYSPLMVQELFKPHSYRIFDIEVLMAFKSGYAFKIYQLSGQYFNVASDMCRTPSYSIDDLRLLFNVGEGKYKNRYDFIRKVIALPLREVNAVGDYITELKDDGGKPSRRMYWFEVRLKDKKLKPRPLLKVDAESVEREKLIFQYQMAQEKFMSLPAAVRLEIREKAINQLPLLEVLNESDRIKHVESLRELADVDFPSHYYYNLVEEYFAPTLSFDGP